MIRRNEIITRNKKYTAHFQTKQYLWIRLEEINKTIAIDNNYFQIENTDLVDNERCNLKKGTEERNKNNKYTQIKKINIYLIMNRIIMMRFLILKSTQTTVDLIIIELIQTEIIVQAQIIVQQISINGQIVSDRITVINIWDIKYISML